MFQLIPEFSDDGGPEVRELAGHSFFDDLADELGLVLREEFFHFSVGGLRGGDFSGGGFVTPNLETLSEQSAVAIALS